MWHPFVPPSRIGTENSDVPFALNGRDSRCQTRMSARENVPGGVRVPNHNRRKSTPLFQVLLYLSDCFDSILNRAGDSCNAKRFSPLPQQIEGGLQLAGVQTRVVRAPSGARLRCSSQPARPFWPSSRIFMRLNPTLALPSQERTEIHARCWSNPARHASTAAEKRTDASFAAPKRRSAATMADSQRRPRSNSANRSTMQAGRRRST